MLMDGHSTFEFLDVCPVLKEDLLARGSARANAVIGTQGAEQPRRKSEPICEIAFARVRRRLL